MKRIISALLVTLALMLLPAALADVLTLPTSLNTIDEEAFYGDKSLDKVVLGENVTSIGARAFSKSGLKEVTLTAAITSIADDAFEGCNQFKVNVPAGSYAYKWCVEHGYINKPAESPAENFTYEPLNGLYAKITGYVGAEKAVVIPGEIDEYIIQEIGKNAFANNKSIEEVYIPDSVTVISDQAFRNCASVTHVDLGNGVESLGYCAFYACTGLETLFLPDSVTTLDQAVFGNCSNLSYINYPKNWATANSNGYVFAGCPKLTRIDIPVGVTGIPNYAFANCSNLKKITLPEGLEYVYHHAFSKCTGLTEMIYPSTIKTVGGIDGCTGITEITIPDGAKTIGTNAFDSVPIKSITIPQSVEEINDNAFQNCSSLTSISFSNTTSTSSLKKIGYNSFNNCTSLNQIYLPDSVLSIGSNAFSNCKKLSSFHYPLQWNTVLENYGPNDDFDGFIFENCTSLRSITIPEGVTSIPAFAFRGAKYIRNISFPSSLKTIGYLSFAGCEAITNIDFPDNLNLIRISAFKGCTNLQKAILPDSVTTIGSNAFSKCSSLSEFHYPAHWDTVLENYGANDSFDGFIFEDCTALKNIVIPEGVTVIPAFAFRGAKYLRDITLPSTIQTIGYYSFAGCEGIPSMSFPDGLKVINRYAFEGCINLQSALLPDSVTVIGSNAFENCETLSSFHYPLLWNTVLENYGANDDFDGFIFHGCTTLKRIDIPEGVEKIPAFALRGSDNLEIVYVPISVKSIGKYAFRDCSRLTIWTEYGATALQYAMDNNIAYYYLTPDGVNAPSGTLYKGDNYALYGYARSSVNITEVTAFIQNGSGSTVQTIIVNPSVTDYNLAGTVNASLLFGNLSLGSYRYVLKAKTDISEEIWIDSSFTIVPPPLRIYISGYNIGNGIIDSNNVSSLAGMVISNYPITSLTVQVIMSNGTVGYNKTVNPNGLNYNLANLASDIPINKLPVGNYTIRITATANNESRILADNTFQPVSLDNNVDEATVAKVASFVANSSNANLFTTTHVNNILGKMGPYEILTMAVNTRSNWIYGYASTVFTADHANQYLVELYENELADIIADLNPATISIETLDSDKKFIADAILDWNSDLIDAYKQGLMDRFHFKDDIVKKAYKENLDSDFKEFTDALKGVKTALKAVKVSTSLADSIAGNISNYARGLEILSMVADSMDVTGSVEFKAAVNSLYSKYKSNSLNITLTLLRQFSKDILGKGESEVIKMMTNVASESASFLNGGTLYSIINFAIDATMKLTGEEQVAEDYMTFMIQVQAYEAGVTAYREAFNTVQSGDTSGLAINRLLVTFSYARQAGIRIHETISSLKNLTADEAKQVLDYSAKLTNAKIA